MKTGLREKIIQTVSVMLWGRKANRKLFRFVEESHLSDKKFERICPLCGYRGAFRDVLPNQLDGKCPQCGSLERHRLLYLFLKGPENVLADKDVLHFAPEECLRPLGEPARRYVTADLFKDGVDCRIDITSIDFPDEEFDVVLCNHVLEHIPDDALALRELHRILRPGGRAVLTVPIVEGWDVTFESADVRTPQQRTLHYGQADHVRFYGHDFRDRVAAAGFEVNVFQAPYADYAKYSLMRGDKVFVAKKVP
jgi:SAM-dependent methyltransferase